MQQVPPPSGPALRVGDQAAKWRRDKALHRGDMHLHSDCRAKGRQPKDDGAGLAGKTYNDHFSRLMPEMSEDDDFEEEFDDDDEDEFGDEDEGDE